MKRIGMMIAASALLAGCSTKQNIPVSRSFPTIVDKPPTASVFLDQNGTFYPDGWPSIASSKLIEKRGSLLNAIADPSGRERIDASQQAQLAALKGLVEGKKRVVIITHGYNISPDAAGHAFDLVEQRIAWQPGDVLIRVYWDGSRGKRGGEAPIWFASTAASQLAGSRGLRPILNLLRDQDVFLISHSRGASVLLSALSNPTYSANFRRKTRALSFGSAPAFLSPPPLQERSNRIRLLMLAPAIGYPDFWSAACEQVSRGTKRCSDPTPTAVFEGMSSRCPELRAFTPQLSSISHTLNAGDTTLKKWVGHARRYFNATDLGFDAKVGARLEECYPSIKFRPYDIQQTHRHAYVLYAQDPELARMFGEAGLATVR